MHDLIFGDVPTWVSDWGVILGALSALFAVIGSVFVATRLGVKYTAKKFNEETEEVIDRKVPVMIEAAIAPLRATINEINHAVNNVPAGEPTMREDMSTHGDTLKRLELNQRAYMMDQGIAAPDYDE